MNRVRALVGVLLLGVLGCGQPTPAEVVAGCASDGPFTLSKYDQPDAVVDCQVPSGVTVIALPHGITDVETLRAAHVPERMAELLGGSERDDMFCVDAGRDSSDPDLISRATCGSVDFAIPRVMLIEGSVRMRFVAVPGGRPRLDEVVPR